MRPLPAILLVFIAQSLAFNLGLMFHRSYHYFHFPDSFYLVLPSPWVIFAVDGLHNIYGWDSNERVLYKIWVPRYDSVTRIGGVPGEEGFLGVTSIAPVGNQQLYVLDPAAQMITLLGTNLQPLQRIPYHRLPREVADGYPLLLTVSAGGELYLLLRETQEIVKIDPFGRVLLRFGGKVYGPGSILGASALHADGERLFVIDTVRRQILEYDAWGTFLRGTPFPERTQYAWASMQGKVFWAENILYWGGEKRDTFYCGSAIRAVWIQGKRLYWLGERQVGAFLLP